MAAMAHMRLGPHGTLPPHGSPKARSSVNTPEAADSANGNSAEIIREAVRANVRASADHLRHGSALLEQLVVAERVVVVGAEYELESGAVHFFDGVAASRSSA